MAVPARFTKFSRGEWKVMGDKLVVAVDGSPFISQDSKTDTILRFSAMFDADQDAEDGFVNDITGEFAANKALVSSAPKLFHLLELAEELLYNASASFTERLAVAKQCTRLLDSIAGEQFTGLRKYLDARRKLLSRDPLAVDELPKAASPQIEFTMVTGHGNNKFKAVLFNSALTNAPEFWPDWLVAAILRNPREENAVFTDGERWLLNRGDGITHAILPNEWLMCDARGYLSIRDVQQVAENFVKVG